MSDKSLVILAAGLGSRFGGAKQIEPVGPDGSTIMEYSIFDALRTGFDNIVLVVRPELEAPLRAHLEPRVRGRVKPIYVHQTLDRLPPGRMIPDGRKKPWGTGHAVLTAADAAPGPFIVVNADDWYGPRAVLAAAAFLRAGAPDSRQWAMVSYPLCKTLPERGAVSRGLCNVDHDGRLTGIAETRGIERDGESARCPDGAGGHRRLAADTPASMNLWAFTPSIFLSLRRGFDEFLGRTDAPDAEFQLPAAVEALIHAGKATVDVLPQGSAWCGLTNPEDRELVRATLARHVAAGDYPHQLWS